MAFSVIGQSLPRIDGEEKVTGRARFSADQEMRGVLHGRLLLSPYAHARIRRLPTAAALAVPGVVAVVTADDLPFGDDVPNARGRCLLARGEVRFVGDPVAVVVAESEAAAADGLERLASAAEFDPLPSLVDPCAAADPGAPLVQPGLAGKSGEASLHAALKVDEDPQDQKPGNVSSRVRFSRGDIERGLIESDLVIARTFRTSVVHQAYIEPHATVADYDPAARRLTLWTATQGLFYAREHVAQVLGGIYQAPHLDVQGREVLTHKAPTGAYRAPGAVQGAFAVESVMDDLARALNRDPIEMRLQNASQGGDPMPNGESWPRIGLREVLQAVQDDPLWRDRHRDGRGVGVATGGWRGGIEPSSACVRLNSDRDV